MNEQDLYIKKKLKEDELISKKADDVFKNFFKEDMNMNNEKEQVVTEEKISKIQKLSRYKKWMSIAACAVILLGSANVYAMNKGYENVFFMIKYLITGEEERIEGKENILSDKDITISYEKIYITENISMKVTNLKIKDGKAKLYLLISEKELETDKNIVPLKYEVFDENNNRLCSQISSKEDRNSAYTEELELENYKEEDKKIILKVYKANSELAINAVIDLENKTIEIEGEQEALKKVSEIELKEYLGNIVNSFEREDINESISEEELLIEAAVGYGVNKELIEDYSEENENITYKLDDVEKIVSNITERSVKDFKGGNYLEVCAKNNAKCVRWIEAGGGLNSGMCVDISDISYLNGVYTVTFTYVYLGEAPLDEQDISDYDLHKAKVKFKYDETNTISKFKMIDYERISSIHGNSISSVDGEVNIDELELQDISKLAIEYRNGIGFENTTNVNIVRNYKEFQYDLDGNGIDEIVRFEKNKDENTNEAYKIYLNGKEFDCAISEYCSIYIVDLNKNDNKKEVVIFDCGSNDNDAFRIYTLENENMRLVEELNGWEDELKINGNGNIILANKITSYIVPKIYDKIYYYEDGNLTYSNTKINEIENNWYEIYDEYNMILFTEDLNNIMKFLDEESNRGENEDYDDVMERNGLIPIKDNIQFKILEFTDNEEIKVQLKDGKTGYLFPIVGHLAG